MNCPECQIAYDPEHWDSCPHCGAEHEYSGVVELSGVMRTSTILIAAGNRESEVYRSVEEVPEPLRRMLVASTNGLNSGTIYIADQGGRERITQALRSLPAVGSASAPSRFSVSDARQPERRAKRAVSLSGLWFVFVVAGVAGAIVWFAGRHPW